MARFWSYVMAAVRGDDPAFGTTASRHLSSLGPESYQPFIDAFLQELSALPEELALILDDFHVIELAPIYESVAYLLEYLPAHIHIYTASRITLPFPTARLLAKGEMKSISIQDLQFRFAEGIRFFRECMGITLSDDEIGMFVRRTEGWVSGLRLAAITLQRSDDPSAFVRRFSGQQRDIALYLLEEVLGRQPEDIKHFLLQTSILSRMNASLCEAVVGREGAQAELERLERQQLFITRLDEFGETYRYHHLFADFLQQRCRNTMPGRWEEIHAKAARWWEAHGDLHEAAEHWITAGCYAEAASLIENRLTSLQDYRESLLRWLQAMPKPILRKRPFLQLLYVKMMCEAGQIHWAERQLRGLETELSTPDWEPWIGTYYFLSAETALYRRDLQLSLDYLELFDQHEPRGPGSPLQMIAGNTLTGLSYESLLSFFNDLRDAEKFLSTCIRIWEEKGNYPFIGYFYCFYSDILYEWNREEEVEALWNRLLYSNQWRPYLRIRFFAASSLACLRMMKGEQDQAEALMDRIKDDMDTPDQELFLRRWHAEKAYMCIHAGLPEGVQAWLDTCGLKHTDVVPSAYREYYVLARALIEVGRTSEALILVERLLRMTQEKDWLRDQIRVLILQSMALERHGKEEEAAAPLELALHLAEPQGYARSFTDEGKALGGLLVRYLESRQNGSIRPTRQVSLSYIKRLLNRMNVRLAGTLAAPALLTGQESRILRLIEQGYTNRQIAEKVGVSSETVKVHLRNAYQKLEAGSRMQAVNIAKELHLL